MVGDSSMMSSSDYYSEEVSSNGGCGGDGGQDEERSRSKSSTTTLNNEREGILLNNQPGIEASFNIMTLNKNHQQIWKRINRQYVNRNKSAMSLKYLQNAMIERQIKRNSINEKLKQNKQT